jgi:hypothetical protein
MHEPAIVHVRASNRPTRATPRLTQASTPHGAHRPSRTLVHGIAPQEPSIALTGQRERAVRIRASDGAFPQAAPNIRGLRRGARATVRRSPVIARGIERNLDRRCETARERAESAAGRRMRFSESARLLGLDALVLCERCRGETAER